MRKVIVIGGGPAGMMAAVKAAENGAAVTLLEKMKRVGKKMLITGKGRCNLTNSADIAGIIQNIPGNGVFLNSTLRAFDNEAVRQFFEDHGVPVKVERGGRMFPVSDKAVDAVDAMLVYLHELGVDVRTDSRVSAILSENGQAIGVKLSAGGVLRADAVILAVGGASYPGTGSTGDGYAMAAALGHTVTPIYPALVPLETEEAWVKEAQGLSLRNVRVTLLIDGQKEAQEFGEMMFAHFGVTGPVILSLSRPASAALQQGKTVELSINLKPALTPEQLQARIQRDFAKFINKAAKNALHELLPGKLILPVLDMAYIDPEQAVHQITREERLRLAEVLQDLGLTIPRTRPISEAIVTAGGVSVKEINPKTMESRLVHGLYLAGEVMDIDGFTGGYNLQAAFSTGAAAGNWSARIN